MMMLIFFCFIAFLVYIRARHPAREQETDEELFGIMIDAGSTGSRIHVYKFSRASPRGEMILQHELFKQLKPGLSSFKDDAKAGAQSLVPLLEVCVLVYQTDRERVQQ